MWLATLPWLALPVLSPLRNGGFEQGSLEGWLADCATEDCTPPSRSSDARSGGGAALLDATADHWTVVGLQQDVGVLPSCTHRVSAWVKAERSREKRPAAELQLALDFLGRNDQPLAEPGCRLERYWPGEDWTQVSVACAPPATAMSARVWVQLLSVRSDAAALVDDVSLDCDDKGNTSSTASIAAASATGGIPPIVHFIFGLASDFGGKPFSLVHHLVVKSAVHFVAGTASPTVYFYHTYEPSGEWWERTKPLLTLRHMRAPSRVFGNRLRRFAHQADVIRLEVLLSFGGLYLDLDVLLIAPLAPLLALDTSSSAPQAQEGELAHMRGAGRRVAKVILAQEGVDGAIGLGNALMMTPRNHSFFLAWYNEYRHFSDAVWNAFSVRLPLELASRMPGAVHVLSYTDFYWPPWSRWGLSQLYATSRCLLPTAYGVHLWETKMWASLLSSLTPAMLEQEDTCFGAAARAVLSGSFNFSVAHLRLGEMAEESLTVALSRPLLDLLTGQPDSSGHAHSRPEQPLLAEETGRDKADHDERVGRLDERKGCADIAGAVACRTWAELGECQKNPEFMLQSCRRTCGCPR